VVPPDFYADDNPDKDSNSKDIPPGNGDSISPDDNHSAQPTDNPPRDAEYPLEPELEPDREPNMFDNDEEYVGVDDEGLYMPVPSA